MQTATMYQTPLLLTQSQVPAKCSPCFCCRLSKAFSTRQGNSFVISQMMSLLCSKPFSNFTENKSSISKRPKSAYHFASPLHLIFSHNTLPFMHITPSTLSSFSNSLAMGTIHWIATLSAQNTFFPELTWLTISSFTSCQFQGLYYF